jgi:hypothetical protein
VPPSGDADALARALADAGTPAHVRADGRLALLHAPPERFATGATRASAVRLARNHGFTHVALLLDDPAGAPGTAAASAAGPAAER